MANRRSRYKYYACDLITGQVREQLRLTQVSADLTLDQANPGQFSALMPLAGLSPVIAQSRLDATEPGRSTIVVVRDGRPLGEWMIEGWPDRPNNGAPIPINGPYITDYLSNVYPVFTGQPGDLPAAGWAQTDQMAIAAAVAQQCADPITMTTAPPGSRGIMLTIPAVNPSGQLVDRMDWPNQTQGMSAWAMLNDLAAAAAPAGFDWTIDISLIGRQVVRTLVLSYPRRGIDAGIVLQPVQGRPGGNAAHVVAGLDATRLATQVVGLGGGQGVGQTVTRSNNTALVAAFPLRQRIYADSGVIQPAAMQSKTDALAAAARRAQVPPDVTVFADKEPVLGSYGCGDSGTLNLGRSTNFPGGYTEKLRILGIGIRPPAAGPETSLLTLGLVQE